MADEMDPRERISAMLAERQGMTMAQEQGVKDVFKDYQAPYRGAPNQWDMHLDPSLQNRYGNATRPSVEWTGQRPAWANTTDPNGISWWNEGTNVLSPAAPPQYREEAYGRGIGPYSGSAPAGSTTQPFTPTGAPTSQYTPPQSVSPYANNYSGGFGGRMPGGGGMGGGMPSWMSQIQQMLPQGMFNQSWGQQGGMPSSPGGFGGKATPGAPPSTLGASNG